MKKNAFTLVEVLAIIIILGIIATIATPVILRSINQNSETMYSVIENQLIDASKDWAAINSSSLPDVDGEYTVVTLQELKESGLLKLNVKNPRTGKIFSNQSLIRITKKNNNFTHDVITYDLIDADEVEDDAPIITLNGSQIISLNIGDVYQELGVSEYLPISIQIIQEGEEVSNIDTSKKGTYTIYYSLVKDNKIGINIRTVIIK